MKRIIYIFTVLALALFGCSEDNLIQENPTTKEGYVQISFDLSGMPDFQDPTTKAADENTVDNMSLMTFDASGVFLGRVGANISDNGNGTGSGTATILKGTKIIHFIANNVWNGTEYINPTVGQTEASVMQSLATTSKFVAWGKVAGITSFSGIHVDLLRSYAKVIVESTASNFTIGGFALTQYMSKGYITTATNSDFNPIDIESLLLNQTVSDMNMDAKYMFEYTNPSTKQTGVVIKNNQTGKYFKVALLKSDKTPYTIERNYIYKVIVRAISADAGGYDTFDQARDGAANNNIYADIVKEAETVQNGQEKLTVTPVIKMFTQNGTLSFTAKYWDANGNASNSSIVITEDNDAHSIISNLTGSVTNSIATATITVPSALTNIESATISVKAGNLSRTVTVYVSKPNKFNPIGDSYSAVGDVVTLKFSIPSDYPAELMPVKCYIKANDLNPVKVAGQPDMLIEYINGEYFYIYNATTTGDQTLKFKTTRATVENPTISSDYFETGTFIMNKLPAGMFSSIAGTAYYESGSTFDLSFTTDKATSEVTISGDNIAPLTTGPLEAGTHKVTLTTTSRNANGNINLRAQGFDDASGSYGNNGTLQKDYIITGSLKYQKNSNNISPASATATFKISSSGEASSDYVTSGGYIKECSIPSEGNYSMTLKAGTNISKSDNMLKFSLTDASQSNIRYSSSVSLSNFFTQSTDMTCSSRN